MTDELLYRGEGASASRQADPAGGMRRNRRGLVSSGGSEGTEAAGPPLQSQIPGMHARAGSCVQPLSHRWGAGRVWGQTPPPSAPPNPCAASPASPCHPCTMGTMPCHSVPKLPCPVPSLKCPQLPPPTAEAATTGGHRWTHNHPGLSSQTNERWGHCFSHATPKSSVTAMSGL